MSETLDLTRRFEDRMRKTYACAKSLGYDAKAFAGMVAEHGWLDATKILLRLAHRRLGSKRCGAWTVSI